MEGAHPGHSQPEDEQRGNLIKEIDTTKGITMIVMVVVVAAAMAMAMAW